MPGICLPSSHPPGIAKLRKHSNARANINRDLQSSYDGIQKKSIGRFDVLLRPPTFEDRERNCRFESGREQFLCVPPVCGKPLGNVDGHMSWHASGERHAVFRIRRGRGWEKDKRMQKKSIVKMSPPPMLKGVGALYHSGIFYSRFPELPPIGTNEGTSVVLNAQRAHFRDDFTVIRVYLVEPGAEASIPVFPDTGPRILHLIKQMTPWMAVEVYQQN